MRAFAILVFLVAVAISAVAAYFSIVGLAALFAATATGVIVMASVLEVGKIVTAKWVHTHWNSSRVKWWFRGVLLLMIAALMAVTSLGIYGYLSKGHLEQNAPLAGIELQSSGLERQISQKEAEIQRLETRLAQIDKTIAAYLEHDRATQGMSAARQMKAERERIYAELQEAYDAINKLNEELVPLKQESSEVEAKLGPVKYVAELFGFEDPEAAVRIVILLIMLAFDPLAICLIIAASITWQEWQDKQNPPDDEDTISEPKGSKVDTLPDAAYLPEPQYKQDFARLERLREELHADALANAEELKEVREKLIEEREDLDIKNQTLNHALDALAEREAKVKAHDNRIAATDLELEIEAQELDMLSTELAKTKEDLDRREADLNDRIGLLDMIFPKGSTDDQAIINMLERNPKVLEEIIDIINTADRPTPPRSPSMVIKSDPK